MRPLRSDVLSWLASYVQRGKAKAYAKARQMPSAARTEIQVHRAYQALDILLSNGAEVSNGISDYRRVFAFKRSTPCSLDAVIFGHVASARMDKMTGYGELFQKQYPNLFRHYTFIYAHISRSFIEQTN